MGSTPLLCRHHERLCGFVHVRGLSSRTRSRPPHNGSGLRGSKPSLPALPTGLVLSLQCYSCLELENTSQCQPIQCPMSGVCFNSDMTVTLGSGKKVNSQHKGCAPSCEVATKIMRQLSQMTNPESLSQGVLTKFEVQEVTCCEKDLCNGVARMARSSWALAGGLLLSLGPAFLRTLP
uniref:UPAR/Ly6 domain-containing protein n=1 Tax=Panthera leo TaxID=9689 RepID=A0A8C9CV76_PANLE